jgi:hypothetical protein
MLSEKTVANCTDSTANPSPPALATQAKNAADAHQEVFPVMGMKGQVM